jgi:hypothetical protein
MSDVAERLARKWKTHYANGLGEQEVLAGDRRDARWWLNAIADELDRRADEVADAHGIDRHVHAPTFESALRYLRVQARDNG